MYFNKILNLICVNILCCTWVVAAEIDPKNLEIKAAYEDAETDRLIIEFNERGIKNKNHFYYGTESELYQLAVTDAADIKENGAGVFKMNFADHRLDDQRGHFRVDVNSENFDRKVLSKNYTVMCNKKKITYQPLSQGRLKLLQKKIQSSTVSLKPLPDVRKPVVIFKAKNGHYIYLDTNKYRSSVNQYRYYSGKPGDMKENKEINVIFKEDGDLVVRTTGSMRTLLWVPSKDSINSPRWKGEPEHRIERVDEKTFNLSSLKIPNTIYSANLSTPCDKLFANESKVPDPAGIQNSQVKE